MQTENEPCIEKRSIYMKVHKDRLDKNRAEKQKLKEQEESKKM